MSEQTPVGADPTRLDPGRTLPRAIRPFRHRDYRFLVASMGVSLFASGMWIVALVWQVIELGGGPSELSLVATASSLGLLLSVLIGGHCSSSSSWCGSAPHSPSGCSPSTGCCTCGTSRWSRS